MGSRSYKRDRSGRFASSGSAVSTTVGKAGGFANAQFRARLATQTSPKASRFQRVGAGVRRVARNQNVRLVARVGLAALGATLVQGGIRRSITRSVSQGLSSGPIKVSSVRV